MKKKPVISKNIFNTERFLKDGKPVVIKTETLYGILGNALNKNTVEYIYKIKGRNTNKPFIILISSISDLKNFGIAPNEIERRLLSLKGLTVVLDINNPKFRYLHRGTNSLAFRIPAKENLLKLLGRLDFPLVAPSCNPEGKEPAKNIEEAIKYFGEKIPIYIDEGENLNKKPSTIVKIKGSQIIILREGNYTKQDLFSLLKKL